MMRYLKVWALVLLALVMAACGGGGNPGGTSSGGGTTNPTASPSIALSLVDSAGATLGTPTISKGGIYYAKAIAADANGTVLANQLITFSTDYTVATLAGNTAGATVLTDASGVARVLISPVSLTTTGAAVLSASASLNSVSVTKTLNFGTTASNVTLTSLTASPTTIGALETSAVTVVGAINGVVSSGVQVGFNASCGTFSPSSAATNGNGLASATYQSTAACGGTAVTLSASATGAANNATTTIAVTAAKAANIVFTSATPALIYVSSAASGSKTSVVKFQVLDSNAAPMVSQSVSISLSSASIASGVTFSLSGSNSTAAQTVTSDNNGLVSIAVASGTLPTPVSVTATLVSLPAVKASSIGLAVSSGAPTQKAASFNALKHSLEALNIVGLTTDVVFRVADRQSNPVPDGTVVNFVASTGLITGSCTLINSSCTVVYTSQGAAPANGRAVILAYLDGEESFTDLVGDNVYHSNDPFEDTGVAYLDLNGNGLYDSNEQTFPGGQTGSASCTGTANTHPSIANTCDGIWSSNIRIRKLDTITWATSQAVIKLSQLRTASSFMVLVHDNSGAASPGNAMPTGTTVGAAVTSSGSSCVVTAVNPATVNGSAISGTYHTINLNGDASCLSLGRTVTVRTQITAGTFPASPGTITTTTTTTEAVVPPDPPFSVVSTSTVTATTSTMASDNTVTTVVPATAITVTVTSPSGYVTTRILSPNQTVD